MADEIDRLVAALHDASPGEIYIVRADRRARRRGVLEQLRAFGFVADAFAIDAAHAPIRLHERPERGDALTVDLAEVSPRSALLSVLDQARKQRAVGLPMAPAVALVSGLERMLLDHDPREVERRFVSLNLSREALAAMPFALALVIPHWLHPRLVARCGDLMSWRVQDVDLDEPGDIEEAIALRRSFTPLSAPSLLEHRSEVSGSIVPRSSGVLWRDIARSELCAGAPLDAAVSIVAARESIAADDPELVASLWLDEATIASALGQVGAARHALQQAQGLAIRLALSNDHRLVTEQVAASQDIDQVFGALTVEVELRPGDLLGERYELIEVMGRGPRWTTWSARDQATNEHVVLRSLRPRIDRDPVDRSRLESIGQRMVGLRHPNIVPALAWGLDRARGAEVPFTVFKRVTDGETLYRWRGARPLDLRTACDLLLPVAGAVAAMHREGLAHREIASEHIMVRRGALGPIALLVFTLGASLPLSASSPEVRPRDSMLPPPVQRGRNDPFVDEDVKALALVFREVLGGDLPGDPIARGDMLRDPRTYITPLASIVRRSHHRPFEAQFAELVDGVLFRARSRPDASEFLQRALDIVRDEEWAPALTGSISRALSSPTPPAPSYETLGYTVTVRLSATLARSDRDRRWRELIAGDRWTHRPLAGGYEGAVFETRSHVSADTAREQRRVLLEQLGRRYGWLATIRCAEFPGERCAEVTRGLTPPTDGA